MQFTRVDPPKLDSVAVSVNSSKRSSSSTVPSAGHSARAPDTASSSTAAAERTAAARRCMARSRREGKERGGSEGEEKKGQSWRSLAVNWRRLRPSLLPSAGVDASARDVREVVCLSAHRALRPAIAEGSKGLFRLCALCGLPSAAALPFSSSFSFFLSSFVISAMHASSVAVDWPCCSKRSASCGIVDDA